MSAHNSKKLRSIDFFAAHPVFTQQEFLDAKGTQGRSASTSNNLLAQHLTSGRLLRVRRGLYASMMPGHDATRASVDPYLLASHLTEDAVVAYHAALQFYGKTYSVWRRFHYLTALRARPFSFQDQEFLPVQTPAALRRLKDWGGGLAEVRHAGGRVRVTTLERALVDLLDSPDKGGGWEEVWRSLEMVEFFDLDAVLQYAFKLGSALTCARVGFFLDQHRDALMVEDKHLKKLRARVPKQARYLDPAREPGRFVAPWNLVVPERVLSRQWEEPG
jgi:predicted transcriptional regulator of viral defense system